MTPSPARAVRTPVGASLRLADLDRDPFGLLARLRAEEPVSWLTEDRVWLITTHALVDEAHRDQARFATDLEDSEVRQLFGETMLTVDGPRHRIHHAPFAHPLRRGEAEHAYAAPIRAIAEELLGGLGGGRAELIRELARPLALRLVGTVLGFPDGESEEIERLVSDMAAADSIVVTDAVRRRAAATRKRFGVRVLDALEKLADDGAPSVLSAVARTRGQLTDQQVVDNTINMIFGAVDPTAILIGNAIWALLAHPDQLAAVRADRDLIVTAVKEAARWHPPFSASVRYVATDTPFHGVGMRAGEKVYLMILSANRDEHVFRAPERFDIAREDLRLSIAFGRGLHHCIGEALTEIAAREALNATLSALPGLRLDPRRPTEPRGISHHELARLDVLYDA
jgi:cytochrome P450